MNTFIFDGSWNQIKGVLRQKFAQLTDADLEFIQGKGEELLGRLQTKLGLNRAELENMLESIEAGISTGTQAVHEKIGQVKARASEIAGQWKDKAGAVADDIAARASATAAGVEARAGEVYEQARQRACSLRESGEEQVRRKPREAIIIALAAGFLAGLLIRRD
jgi:uncharacterized protein YjbJ (UPF0337 family)